MAATDYSIANMDGAQYAVSWKGLPIGWTKTVDPSAVKPKVYERKIGELNNIVIDRIRKGGAEGAIKITLHEASIVRIRTLLPHAGSTGAFTAMPTSEYYSEYDNSGPLVLHPRHLPAATTTDDITILHAFPTLEFLKSAGEEDRDLESEWNIFPDRTALTAVPSTIVYAYYGPAPT